MSKSSTVKNKLSVSLSVYFSSDELAKHIYHTHMNRLGTPQNFCLTFIDELENNYLLKKLLKWANKKYKNFYIYNIV